MSSPLLHVQDSNLLAVVSAGLTELEELCEREVSQLTKYELDLKCIDYVTTNNVNQFDNSKDRNGGVQSSPCNIRHLYCLWIWKYGR